jgi:hypothetical protein
MKTIAMMLLAASTAFAGDESGDAARKLESKVSLGFRGAKMTEVLEVFRSVTGLNFVAIDGAETTVTLTVRDITAKSALKLILQPAGLGAAFEHGSVVIRNRESRTGATTLRIYDVRSMLVKLKDFPGIRIGIPQAFPLCSLGCFPFLDDGPVHWLTEDLLVDLVRAETGGRSWDEHPRAGMTLVSGLLYVTQTPRVQREIEAFLARLPA